jgi:hypothetical protein
MNKNQDKHVKYKNYYKPGKVYWGLGIENEVYLECEQTKVVNKDFILNNKNRERYSVDYFSNYKSDELLKKYNVNEFVLPILLNSHSFTKTDKNNNPKTLYTKLKQPNPKYTMSLLESLIEDNRYFKDNDTWTFDGDTIEFTTLNFFNTTLNQVIRELVLSKDVFIRNLNESFKRLGINYNVSIMKKNYPFASYLTNIYNVNMFNNGTLHYNITLPTKLNNNNEIEDCDKFIKDHSKAIKIIQWMEPFLIAVYGSPEPLGNVPSQRCGVSRYIGVGTYDSDTMIPGKILSLETKKLNSNHWYKQFDFYTKLESVGLDINFNKHYNHGIELRFFDYITDTRLLAESFQFIIYLMDCILTSDRVTLFGNPITSKLWNNFVLNVMTVGKEYILTDEEKYIYEKLFHIKIKKKTVNDIYYEIYKKINSFFSKKPFSSLTLRKEVGCNTMFPF